MAWFSDAKVRSQILPQFYFQFFSNIFNDEDLVLSLCLCTLAHNIDYCRYLVFIKVMLAYSCLLHKQSVIVPVFPGRKLLGNCNRHRPELFCHGNGILTQDPRHPTTPSYYLFIFTVVLCQKDACKGGEHRTGMYAGKSALEAWPNVAV